MGGGGFSFKKRGGALGQFVLEKKGWGGGALGQFVLGKKGWGGGTRTICIGKKSSPKKGGGGGEGGGQVPPLPRPDTFRLLLQVEGGCYIILMTP